jgi:hypothetical protein
VGPVFRWLTSRYTNQATLRPLLNFRCPFQFPIGQLSGKFQKPVAMSLLFPEDDDILEEMFALIDSSDVGSDKDSDASVTRKPAPTAPLRNAKTTATANPAKPKKKRIRRPETSSTAFQRRKKAEILALREEAQVLESRLKHLKEDTDRTWEKCSPGVELENESESSWAQEAVKQYRLRTEAEELNRTLKGLWANQFHMNKSIRAVLQRRSALYVSALNPSRSEAFVVLICAPLCREWTSFSTRPPRPSRSTKCTALICGSSKNSWTTSTFKPTLLFARRAHCT